MSTTVTENVEELFDLVRKSEGIISTFDARDLESEPETVQDDYRRYAQTHVSLGDTGEFESDVFESVTESDSPTKGYLYGKYGYGKTSTSVSIWNTLSENEIIAVPPFTFDSFTAVMRATYGWMHYEFRNKAPGYVDEVEEIHDQYLQQELHAVAKEGETEHDLDANKLASFLEDSDFDPTITADTLIDFFDDCTALALEAGFDALVIVADEFQEYFNSADNEKDAESRFRQLVFGLQSGAQIRGEFGLFISMPEKTKSMLDSRAEDILNRLQRDNLVLNLQNVYGRDFPAELWTRYAEQFNFTEEKHNIITDHALTAIGEVCSRNDLSNGPRTVMDIFRIALVQYRDQQEAFTALDFAEAFYQGEVRYTGSATKIQSAIGDALDQSVVNSEAKQQFIKLCAVFPEEGIPDAIVDEYGLDDVRTALSKKLHGEVIKVVADGYTLTDVTNTETIDPIRELIRDFWRDYSVGHAAASDAINALANQLVNGELFEPQRGTLDGWTNGGNNLNSLNHTAYRDQFEGSFDTRYPKRRISLGVCDDEAEEKIIEEHGDLGESFGDPDLALNFMLHWQKGDEEMTEQYIEAGSDREYTFILNGRQSFDELPKGLDFLRDAMDPKAVTPFLMLALADYLDDPKTELGAQQQNRVESFQQSLLNQSRKELLDEELINNAPFELRRAGKRAVSGVFTKAMEEIYPEYSTVITSPQYRDPMDDYVDFLGTLETTSQRRGKDTVLEETPEGGNKGEGKQKMAKRFGLRRTSSFDNRLKKHYSDLITIVDDDSDHYELRVDLHPFEKELIERLEAGEDDALPIQDVESLALEMGYRDEEITVLSQFIQKRGIVGMNDSGNALVLQEVDVTIEQVEQALEACQDYIETIESLDPDRVPDNSSEIVETLSKELERTNPEDGDRLEALQVEAEHLIERLEEAGELLYDHYKSTCGDVQRDAKRTRRSLTPDHLEDEVTSGVEFVGGLNDARTDLQGEFRDLRDELSDLIDDLEQTQSNHSEASVEAAVELHEQIESARDRLDEIESKVEELETHADELKRWRTFTDKVANVKEDIRDYSRTFDESIEEEDRINEIIAEIRERLAEDPLDALTNREAFDQRVDDINDSYQQRRDERREVFNAKQDTLNTILNDATDGRSTNLRVTFDVKEPSKSQRRLLNKFKDAYESQVLDQAESRLETASNEIEYAQIVEVETDTDADPDRVAERIEQAQATLRQLRSQLSRFDLDDITDETALDTDGADVLTTADELQREAKAFRAQSEPDSEEVQDLLERVENNHGADFKELLMEYHEDGEEIDVDDLLERIEQLFKLNQIDIKISQRRGR